MDLAVYLTAKGVTQASFADRIGVSQATLSRYARRTATPTVTVAERIKAASGGEVTYEDWLPMADLQIREADYE